MPKRRFLSRFPPLKKKIHSLATTTSSPQFNCASFRDLLRYADGTDYALLVCGLVVSILAGATHPVNTFFNRDNADTLMRGQFDYKNGSLDMAHFVSAMRTNTLNFFLMGIAAFFLNVVAVSSFFTLMERQVHRIRKKVFQAIINKEMEWFDRNEVGVPAQKMITGIERIQAGMSDKLCMAIQAVSHLVFGVATGLWMNWRMALAALAAVPLLMLSIYGISGPLARSTRKEMQVEAKAGEIAGSVLTGIRTVASFNGQSFEMGRYSQCLREGCRLGIHKALSIAFFTALYLLFLFSLMGITFAYGAELVHSFSYSPGTVFAVFWAVVSGAQRLGGTLPTLSSIIEAKLAAGELFSIIDSQPPPRLVNKRPTASSMPSLRGHIKFSSVHFRYATRPEVEVLKGVSLEVAAEENIALVGHSGSGKSTIVSLLMAFHQAESGEVSIDGVPIQSIDVEHLRMSIGLVSQQPEIFAGTIFDNVRMGKGDATHKEVERACHLANAHQFIQRLSDGYDTRLGVGGVQLSGGEKQRLCIARALVRQPKILLLDEATSALDNQSERVVQEALDRASAHCTTITIAHRLSTIRKANRILVFDAGTIVEVGTHKELMQKKGGIYKQMVAAQEMEKGLGEEQGEEDLGPLPFIRSSTAAAAAEAEERIERASAQFRSSIASIKEVKEIELEETKDELSKEGICSASIFSILRYARPEWKLIGPAFFVTLVRGLAWPIFAVLYGRMFLSLSDSFSQSGEGAFSTTVLLNCAAFVVLGVGASLSTFGSGAMYGVVGERVTMRLRMDVFSNLVHQDGRFFDKEKNSVSRLTGRLAVDAPSVQAAIDSRFAEMLQGCVSLLVSISVAFYYGWMVAPVCIACALALFVVRTFFSSYVNIRAAKDRELSGEASRIAAESIEYVRTVQALSLQQHMYEAFNKASALPHRRALIRGVWHALLCGVMYSLVMLNFASAYFLGTLLIQSGYTTPFILFQVIEALSTAMINISVAAQFLPEYHRAKIAAGRIFSMLEERAPSGEGITQEIKGSFEAKDAFFAYPNSHKRLVLKGLSFKAEFGRTVALVGASGCGKSTVFQLAERFYRLLDGCLMVDGIPIEKYSLTHLRAAMAHVGQEVTLFDMTIRESILYAMDDEEEEGGMEERMIEAAKLANIHSFIECLPMKYDTPIGMKGAQLSGGQRQRLAIARAIVRQPKILLLDEATSALDSESERLVQEALDKARAGRTCLVIAHRLSTIQHSDTIVVMKEGRVAEMGNHDELMQRKGIYWKLVGKQEEEE